VVLADEQVEKKPDGGKEKKDEKPSHRGGWVASFDEDNRDGENDV